MLVDIHAHLNFRAFDSDRDEVIKRTHEGGVRCINVGTQLDTSKKALAIAERFDGMYATVGLHPIHTERSYQDPKELDEAYADRASLRGANTGFISREEVFDFAAYESLARRKKVVAIGECGLDYFRLGEQSKAKQRAALLMQIDLAARIGKPLMIHCRDAHDDLIAILRDEQTKRKNALWGNVHFYSGTLEQAHAYIALGFTISFTGVITFARDRDEIIKSIPLEYLMVETDAPYAAPVPHRGKRNEPLYVFEVAKRIAQLRGTTLEDIARITTQNAGRVFGIT